MNKKSVVYGVLAGLLSGAAAYGIGKALKGRSKNDDDDQDYLDEEEDNEEEETEDTDAE